MPSQKIIEIWIRKANAGDLEAQKKLKSLGYIDDDEKPEIITESTRRIKELKEKKMSIRLDSEILESLKDFLDRNKKFNKSEIVRQALSEFLYNSSKLEELE